MSRLFFLFLPLTMIGCNQPALSPLALQSFGDDVSALESLLDQAAPPPPSAEDRAIASTLRARGLELRNQGQFEGAIATLQESVTLDPTSLSGYVILGWTQHLATQRDDAKTTLLMALKTDPDHVPALNALGIVYLVDGELDKAVETHTQALTLKPDNEIAAYNLSLAYQRLQQYTAAIDHALLATELEAYNPHPWVALAIAHHSNNNPDEALRAYRQALSLDGRYGDRPYLDHLEQAGFSAEQIQLTSTILDSL
jgi:Flp pilus assembly protein TadD